MSEENKLTIGGDFIECSRYYAEHPVSGASGMKAYLLASRLLVMAFDGYARGDVAVCRSNLVRCCGLLWSIYDRVGQEVS